jgi:hypothetical protein|tara:strand:+ start:99 stop:293 length:195 start_codon:yes stop_codon:yes gene_type:complete
MNIDADKWQKQDGKTRLAQIRCVFCRVKYNRLIAVLLLVLVVLVVLVLLLLLLVLLLLLSLSLY